MSLVRAAVYREHIVRTWFVASLALAFAVHVEAAEVGGVKPVQADLKKAMLGG